MKINKIMIFLLIFLLNQNYISYAYTVPSPRPLKPEVSSLRYELSLNSSKTNSEGAELIQIYSDQKIVTIERSSGKIRIYKIIKGKIVFEKIIGKFNFFNFKDQYTNFKINNFIYRDKKLFTHVTFYKKWCNKVMIFETSLSNLNTSKVLFQSDCDPSKNELMGGGLLLLDDNLYATIGDTRFNWPDTKPLVQFFTQNELTRVKSSWGKVHQINLITSKASVYSIGHRNPLSLFSVFNFKNKKLQIFETEMGPEGGDELNLLERQKDYGWPLVSYGRNYDVKNPTMNDKVKIYSQNHQQFEEPIFTWLPSMNPTEGVQILNNKKFTDWNGNLMIATLTGNLVRIILDYDSMSVIGTEIIDLGPRIRDLLIAGDGEIIASTDDGIFIVVDLKNKLTIK